MTGEGEEGGKGGGPVVRGGEGEAVHHVVELVVGKRGRRKEAKALQLPTEEGAAGIFHGGSGSTWQALLMPLIEAKSLGC